MSASDGDTMIEGLGLSKTYRGARVPALQDVSVSVAAGEILGVIGPNGSGKTTLMGCLLGLLRPGAGAVRLGGLPVGSIAAKRLVGYLPERLGFDPWMRGFDFVAYHHALAGLASDQRAIEVGAALGDVGLDRAAWSKPIRLYSRGMLQRVGLAQALVGRPRCLFLDEPTSGMDPDGVLLVRARIQAFAAAGGAVLVNSHQLDQLGRLCHRVVFLKQGRLEGGERLHDESGVGWYVEWRPSAGAREKAAAVADKLGLEGARLTDRSLRAQLGDEGQAAGLVAALVKAGLPVHAAGPLKGDLEKFFTGVGHASE